MNTKLKVNSYPAGSSRRLCRAQAESSIRSTSQDAAAPSRRELLAASSAALLTLQAAPTFAKRPVIEGLKGPITGSDYSFFVPSMWESVYTSGVDEVYMDIIEQLENLTLKRKAVDINSLDDLGAPEEVAQDLTKRVIVNERFEEYTISDVKRVTKDDYPYLQWQVFSVVNTTPNEARFKGGQKKKYDLVCVTVRNSTLYFFRAGCEEKRAKLMLQDVTNTRDSFKVFNKQQA